MRSSRLLAVAALILVLLSAGVQAEDGSSFEARLESLQALVITATEELDAQGAAPLRGVMDADASGVVSGQEVTVFVRALEYAVLHPDLTAVELLDFVWSAQNETGTASPSFAGRTAMVFALLAASSSFGWSATMDGVPGTIARIAVTLLGATGSVSENATMSLFTDLRFAWSSVNTSVENHALELSAPPNRDFTFRLPGSLRLVAAANVANGAADPGATTLTGTTANVPLRFTFQDRPVSTAAGVFVALAVFVPAAFAAFAATVWSRRHEVEETPIPIVPKYR